MGLIITFVGAGIALLGIIGLVVKVIKKESTILTVLGLFVGGALIISGVLFMQDKDAVAFEKPVEQISIEEYNIQTSDHLQRLVEANQGLQFEVEIYAKDGNNLQYLKKAADKLNKVAQEGLDMAFPPKEYIVAHHAYREAMKNYIAFAKMLPKGLENVDSEMIVEANNQLPLANTNIDIWLSYR